MLARTPLEQLLTVDNVAAWLRTMPAEGVYLYNHCCGCALWHFCQDHGYSVMVWPGHVMLKDMTSVSFPREIERAVMLKPHTYGAALARLEAVL